jgi:DnaJ domain
VIIVRTKDRRGTDTDTFGHRKLQTIMNSWKVLTNVVQCRCFRAVTIGKQPRDFETDLRRKIASRKLQNSFATITLRENPYTVLNVPQNSSYATVKAAFIKAALKHHPDHSKSPDSTSEFVRIRQAFEQIVSSSGEKPNDINTNSPIWETDADFYEWFKMSTGEYLAFEMNHQTRKEVIHVYRTMSSGGLDRGGHWEMARQLTEREDMFIRAGGCNTGDSDNEKPSSGRKTTSSTCDTLRRKRKR